MANVKATVNPVLVVSFGQSLWHQPTVGTDCVEYIRSGLGYATYDAAQDGISWLQLSRWYPWLIIAQANSAPTTILVCMGGTTDLDNSVGRTGAQAYANLTTIKDAAVTAGYDYTVNVTLTPAFGITGTQESVERPAFNTACTGNAAGFDAVADVAGIVNLQDKTNTTYYNVDQTHWTQAGCDLASALINSTIDSLF